MKHKRETKLDCLFSKGAKLDNLKFFRGSDAEIEEDKFLVEVCSSVERSRAPGVQLSANPPKCNKSPVDLKALVAAM